MLSIKQIWKYLLAIVLTLTVVPFLYGRAACGDWRRLFGKEQKQPDNRACKAEYDERCAPRQRAGAKHKIQHWSQ